MAEQKSEAACRQADEQVQKRLPPGVKLVRTLRGHTNSIGHIAWSPDGQTLASPSYDNTIRVWDTETGKCLCTLNRHTNAVISVAFDSVGRTLASGSKDYTSKLWEAGSRRLLRTLEGHKNTVWSVAFDPTGRTLASGSVDKTVKLWDTDSGRLLRTLEGHEEVVCSVAFDPQGRTVASGSSDKTVMLWQSDSGRLLRTLEGHQNSVDGVAFDQTGRILASGSFDKTVKLWDTDSGRLLRTLEGHRQGVCSLAFLSDGRLVGSKGADNTIRLWSSDVGTCLGIIIEPCSGHRHPGLAFHPHLPLLATVGSDPGTPEWERDRTIHIWELDLVVLLGQPVASTVTYTSAKIVLVGESNVGKSYLAHRIAMGSPPEEGSIKSTHGMKFWPLEPERLSHTAKAPEGQRRDVVLWDMGGQEEYRLIHQLFLHDTTVALALLDPTRGATAFKEVETWNKFLDKQLRGRLAKKLLVGAKLDKPSDTIDRQGIKRLCKDCGFVDFYETSALTGRGLPELCEAIAEAIDWDGLAQTSRPELFQAIRDEIEIRRLNGIAVVLFRDLEMEVLDNERVFEMIDYEIAMASDADAGTHAIDAVCCQLSQQGLIADTRTRSGERALILRVEEVERYAGSLILAARNNPRAVPALELRAIAQADFALPGITQEERLPRDQEKPVIECTVQIMLEHGVCFQHEGLLIFPTLFAPASVADDVKLPHAVSLYYDFAGAIDNIYASLVAWLVLARDFGRVRLWPERAEFEVKNRGLCGLRKVARSGGFAHVDVYFEADTPEELRLEFISFVEDHLAKNGLDICEHIAITCPCGHELPEDTLRQRIARGDKDVMCPVCETRHSLTEGATQARERDSKIIQRTFALRTKSEQLREKVTRQAVELLEKAEVKPTTGPIRLLHLSDLHFTAATPVPARLQWLLDDLKLYSRLGFKELDYLAISGDFTDKGCSEGFEKALEFVSGLTREFHLSAERCIFVPGNHDVVDRLDAYMRCNDACGLKEGEWFQEGKLIMARDPEKYPLRFQPFSDSFYHKFIQRPYPTDYTEQGMAIPFWETGIQFLTLNSCWQIDEFNPKRVGVHPEAVANVVKQAQKQEEDARKTEVLAKDKPLLRIAVWHHAVTAPDYKMTDLDFLGHLRNNGVKLALHGDVHEMRQDKIGYRHAEQVHIVGSGSFGARAEDRPEATARLYNVLEIARDLKSVRIHTRQQRRPDGAWDGWHEWPDPDGGKGRVPYYDTTL